MFHRIVEDFVAQAGNPSGLGYLGPGYLTEDEIDPNLTFDGEGALAMAKANDDDNGSQFFITIVPSSQLDGNFTIFGQVSEDTFGVLESLPATEGENVSEAEPPFIEEQFFYFYNPGRAGQGRAGQGRAGQPATRDFWRAWEELQRFPYSIGRTTIYRVTPSVVSKGATAAGMLSERFSVQKFV